MDRRSLLKVHEGRCDGLQFHVGRALVNLADLRIAKELLRRVLGRATVAAEHFEGLRRARRPGRQSTWPWRPGVASAGTAPQPPCGAPLRRRAGAPPGRTSPCRRGGNVRLGSWRSVGRIGAFPARTRWPLRARLAPDRPFARRCRCGPVKAVHRQGGCRRTADRGSVSSRPVPRRGRAHKSSRREGPVCSLACRPRIRESRARRGTP